MKLESFKPLNDRIVVKRVDVPEVTKGGVYVAVNSEKPSEGLVVAVGEGRVLDDGTVRRPRVKVGSRVLFGKYSGSEVKIDEEDYIIMREDDILGVFRGT